MFGQQNYTTVLVGFNPVQLARSAPIEKWNKTCKDVSVVYLRLNLREYNGYTDISGP